MATVTTRPAAIQDQIDTLTVEFDRLVKRNEAANVLVSVDGPHKYDEFDLMVRDIAEESGNQGALIAFQILELEDQYPLTNTNS